MIHLIILYIVIAILIALLVIVFRIGIEVGDELDDANVDIYQKEEEIGRLQEELYGKRK